MENAKMKKFNCDILSNFQTLWYCDIVVSSKEADTEVRNRISLITCPNYVVLTFSLAKKFVSG